MANRNVNSIQGCINRSVTSRSGEVNFPSYLASLGILHPVLGTTVVERCENLGGVQQKAKKPIGGLGNRTCKERLGELVLFSLEKRTEERAEM